MVLTDVTEMFVPSKRDHDVTEGLTQNLQRPSRGSIKTPEDPVERQQHLHGRPAHIEM